MNHAPVSCRECGILFSSDEAYRKHRLEMMLADQGHLHCPICQIKYEVKAALEAHMQQRYNRAQELECPGCAMYFSRVGSLINHLERDRCPVISAAAFAETRDNKLAIAERLSGGNHPGYSSYLRSISTTNYSSQNLPSNPQVNDRYNSIVRGHTGSRLNMDSSRQVMDSESLDIHDPHNPRFNISLYYNEILGKFKCPKSLCSKSFAKPGQLVGHLKSSAHLGSRKVQCPYCLRYFDNITALTQHSESQGKKCRIRDTESFETYMDQLTGGIASVAGRHDDMTVKYVVASDAVQQFRPEQPIPVAETNTTDSTPMDMELDPNTRI